MATRKHTSPVWDYFELTEGNVNGKKVICKLCDGLKLAYGGGTSNLMNHLEAKHRVEYNKTVPSETEKKKQATLFAFQAKKCSPDCAN